MRIEAVAVVVVVVVIYELFEMGLGGLARKELAGIGYYNMCVCVCAVVCGGLFSSVCIYGLYTNCMLFVLCNRSARHGG